MGSAAYFHVPLQKNCENKTPVAPWLKMTIEEENLMFSITESSFPSAILISEDCTLSANEIVRFESQLHQS